MDINELKKLIKMVEQSDITKFSIEEGNLKVKISKNSKVIQTQVQQPPMEIYTQPQLPNTIASEKTEEIKETSKGFHEIKSPIVGTFYRAPAPDADSYVQMGDMVAPGSVLCIVEAMKLMNEIESDVSGKIVKFLVDNATPVEYNQPLFLIELD